MKQKIFFLLAVAAIFISCKKDNNSLQLAGQYKPNTNGSVGPVIMYSSQGQVTNAVAIQSFLQRQGVENEFIFSGSSFPIGSNDLFTLAITQNNKVTISAAILTEPRQAEIVDQTSSQLLIALIDSVQSFIPIGNNNRCAVLYPAIKKINSEKKYTPLPPGSGYSGVFTFRTMFPIEIENGQFTLPLTTFLVSSSTVNNSCMNSASNEWNTFNPDIITQLQTGDTIVYQTKRVQLLKQ